MVAAGVAAGDRVALVSRTRYEWTLVDYAIWFAGAVSVPIYETSSAEQISWILRDSAATAVVAEASTHTARVASVRGDLDLAPPRVVAGGQRRRRPHAPGRRHRRRRARGPAYDRDTPRPGDADLHLGNHGPPQGLHAHARQLPLRARRGRFRAARAVRPRGRRGRGVHAAVPPPRPRLRPDHPDRLHQGARHVEPLLRREDPDRRPRRGPAHVRARRAPGLREGLQHRLPTGDGRRAGSRVRPRGRGGDGVVARPGGVGSLATTTTGRDGRVRSPYAASTRSSRGSSTRG